MVDKVLESETSSVAVITEKSVNQEVSISLFNSIDSMLAFGEKIVKSGLSPLKKAEDVMAAILYGRELGLAPMQSLNNIYPINGKATTGVHIITALLLKAGVKFEVLEDYAPLYLFIDRSKTLYGEEDVCMKPELFQIVFQHTPESDYDKTKNQVQLTGKVTDRRTKMRFTRTIKQEKLELTISRRLRQYDYLVNSKGEPKDNWANNPQGMLFTRVLAIGGRIIAADALQGIYLPEEMDGSIPLSNAPLEVSEIRSTITQEEKQEITQEITV